MPVLDCATNTAQVEWEASGGADSYIVQAFGVQEHETGCETDSESCILPDLLCGFTYNITVIAVNSVCNVSQSDMTQLQAGEEPLRAGAWQCDWKLCYTLNYFKNELFKWHFGNICCYL